MGCGGSGGGNGSITPEEVTTINVTGRIADSLNNPIEDATVTITSDPVVVKTNQWGEFSAKVGFGEHTLTITKNNVVLYRQTFTAREGFPMDFGVIVPNYPGNGTGEGEENGGTDTIPPAVPAGLSASAAASSQVNISWNPSTDAVGVTGYRVYRNGSLITTVTGTSASDTGLSPLTQYCYTVSAGDAAGNWSAQSSQACVTTGSSSSLAISSTVPAYNAKNIELNTPIRATFNGTINQASVSASSFAVAISAGASVAGTLSASGATITFTPAGPLANGTTYRVLLKSGAAGIRDTAGNTLASDYTWKFTTVYGSIPDLFMQFMNEPTQTNYDMLMAAIAAAGDTKEAKLYKALAELLDIYNSPKTRQIIQDAGLPAIGFDTDFDQMQTLYDINSIADSYFKQNPSLYASDSLGLFQETEDRLAAADALLAEADGIDLSITYGPLYTVRIDSIDIKLIRFLMNLAKAHFIYLQSLNLGITNYTVSYNNVTYDIRDLYTNRPVTDDYGAMMESAWLQVLNNNPGLLTYKDRSVTSKLAQFRSTLQTAFGFYGSAVADLEALSDDQRRDRYNNAFNLDGDATMAMAQLVRDQSMKTVMDAITGFSQEVIFPRQERTGSEYVPGPDDLYYLRQTYDIFLDHYCPDPAASEITAYRLFGIGDGADKTPRDLILEASDPGLPEDTEYSPYIVCGSPALFLSNVSDIIWDDFLETLAIPTAIISIDGSSADWDSVPALHSLGMATCKIARDTGNNVYLCIIGTYVPPSDGTYWHWMSSFFIHMAYDRDGQPDFRITWGIDGSSNDNGFTPTVTIEDIDNTVYSYEVVEFMDGTLGLEVRAACLARMLLAGSENYLNSVEYDSGRGYYLFYGRDLKLLPEMP